MQITKITLSLWLIFFGWHKRENVGDIHTGEERRSKCVDQTWRTVFDVEILELVNAALQNTVCD